MERLAGATGRGRSVLSTAPGLCLFFNLSINGRISLLAEAPNPIISQGTETGGAHADVQDGKVYIFAVLSTTTPSAIHVHVEGTAC